MCNNEYCRTCAQPFGSNNTGQKAIFTDSGLVAIINSLQEWSLDIKKDDDLPQVVCDNCELKLLQIGQFQAIATKAKNYLKTLFRSNKQFKDKNLRHTTKRRGIAASEASIAKTTSSNEQKTIPLEFETITIDESQLCDETMHPNDVGSSESTTGDIQYKTTSIPIKSISKSATGCSKELRCNYCMGKVAQLPVFSTALELQKHIATVHDDRERPYNCPQCPARYQTKGGCQLHINAKHLKKSVFCHICGKEVIGGVGKMREHIERNHTHADYTCDICHLVMKNVTLYNFNYHKRWHSADKLLKCERCDKTFVRRAHLLAHQTTHTKQGQFLCTHCGKSARSKWELRAHLYAIHGEGEAPLSCNYCDKKFAQYSHRSKHLEKFHPRELAKSTVACKICHKRFQTEVNLQRHLKLPHKTVDTETTPAAPQAKAIFHCTLCPRKFRVEYALKKHAEAHSLVGRPYPCDECNMCFKRQSLLKIHKNQHHTTVRPFQCAECYKAFSNKSALAEHLKIHEVKYRAFRCVECNQKFKLEKSLKLHQMSHNKMRHACEICKKLFITKSQLQTHINRYHKLQTDIDVI